MDSVSSDDYYYATAFLSQRLDAADDDDDGHSVASLSSKSESGGSNVKKYPCDNCGKVYTLRHNLNRHKKYECGKQPQLVCSFCQKKFTYKSTLQLHVAISIYNVSYAGPIPTPEAIFPKQRRRYPLPQVAGERREANKCEQCGKMYARKVSLVRHIRHECGKEPQLQCPHCPRRFTYNSPLQLHVLNNHSTVLKK
ncbi:hypothetical protein LSTR_LSTR001003 [Laodelphax striatellus]|uniref:C2H2-type domain-containing protein n=1 Tax=Laodelphax striatellus TaxID=195883 RepID=A0A482X1F3_LAOST|nr:hypothetical protein LSTR_LSTR001003 [Laodelphax striatellus]